MKAVDKNEMDEIKKTVQYYIDAVTSINLDLVKKAWHDEGRRMFIDSDGKIAFLHSPTKDDVEKIKEALKQTQQSGVIEKVDISGSAAVVRIKWTVKSPRWSGNEINFLSLLKSEGKWIIVSKIAHSE